MTAPVYRWSLLRATSPFVLLVLLTVSGCGGSSNSDSPSSSSAAAASASGSSTPATSAPETSAPIASPPATTVPSNVIGSATVSWTPPQLNNDGSALVDLAGYRIHYGNSADNMAQVVNIPTVGITAYVIDNLKAGTWYFAVRAFNSAGIESDLSNVASKSIG